MRFRPIGELTQKISTWNPGRSNSTDDFTYIDLGSIDQLTKKISNPQRVANGDAPSRARQLVRGGDVIVSTVRPNLNGVATVPMSLDGATASTGFTVLRPTAELESAYLFYWVRSPSFISEMSRRATGQSYPAVSDRIVKESMIPAPSILEQQRIARVLSHVDELRAKRRLAIDLLNGLVESVFVDMFGDVATNSRGWDDSRTLGEVAFIGSGITKGRKVSGQPLRSIPYMAVANVQARRLDLSVVKEIEATADEIDRYRLLENDLLLTEGGDPDKLGRGTLWRSELPDCIHQNHIFRVRLRGESGINPVFLNWLVASNRGRRYFLRSAKQTTGIASINATQLKKFPLLSPPEALQRDFAARASQIDRCRALHEKHLAELDALFGSIQHRAFRGELWPEGAKFAA